MDQNFNYWLPISKVDKTAEGHRIVSGYASTPALDLDGEVISIDAVKAALPGYMEWRNIRQMHQPIAVGVAKEASIDEKGMYLTSKIVDANAIKLLDEGVLKGYSIGGKKLSKKGNVVTEIDLVEVSLVDRPANPDCRLDAVKSAQGKLTLYTAGKPSTMAEDLGAEDDGREGEVGWLRKMVERFIGASPTVAKAAPPADLDASIAAAAVDAEYEELCKRKFSDKERQEAADKGEAMPGGGYPIKNEQDLKNAIQAFGRAKDKEATKKHIISRAKALGCTDCLPKDWTSSTKKSPDEDLLDLVKSAPGFFGDVVDPVDAAAVPLLVEFAKSPDSIIIFEPDARERLAKGITVISDLAYAFDNLRRAQRRLVAEGIVEKDGDDQALAGKLGEIASELAAVMAQKATHEGSEAVFLTDAEDISSWEIGQGVFLMNEQTGDLAKRGGEAIKAALGKASGHIVKAGKSNGETMRCMKALGKMFGEHAQKCAEVAKSGGKDKPELDMKKAAELVKAAFDHAGESGDHMEMANVAMARLANGTVTGDHGVSGVAPATMTEGSVPWYDADKPYDGKAASTGDGQAVAKTYTQAEVDALTKTAALQAENDALKAALSKTPNGAFKGRTVIAPAAGEGDDMQLLMKGVHPIDQNDPKSVQDAAGAMIGNMIANSGRFGKSVFDPAFRGQAGVKRQQ